VGRTLKPKHATAFALVTPLGALLFYLGAGHLAHSHGPLLGGALAFCAVTFLCIACSDLLPEIQFHAHDRLVLSLAVLAGLAVAVVIGLFSHAGLESPPVANSRITQTLSFAAPRFFLWNRAVLSQENRLKRGASGKLIEQDNLWKTKSAP
jgi:hypothetical protein